MNNINIKCNANQFFLIGGPCVIENEQITYEVAEHLKNITTKHHIPFIFKASFKKENRTQLSSFTGPGIEKGLKILENIKINMVVQVNGKTRDVLNLEKDMSEINVNNIIKKSEKAFKHLSNKKILKTIFIKNKIINYIIEN